MAFEDEMLVEKAPVLPDAVAFDSVFSNDLAEEQEYDLCYEADADDELISMVSQDELFTEAGYERPINYQTLIEEGEDDEEDFDDAADDTSSSDVDDSNDNGSGDDENVLEDPEEGEEAAPEPVQAPTVQVNVDADDVNITAEAPSNEGYYDDVNLLDLDEDDVNIDHADVVNVISDENEAGAPTSEPASAPVPSNDDVEVSGPTAVAPNDAIQDEPAVDEPNLLDDPDDGEGEVSSEEEPAVDDGSEDDGVSDEEEPPVEDNEDECDTNVEECDEANLLECDPFDDQINSNPTNGYDDVPYEEIAGTTDTPNLLEADDEGDPTLGEAPEGQGPAFRTPNPSMRDTSAIHGPEDDNPKQNGKEKEDAMTTVDDLGFSEQNLLEVDEDPQEDATEEDAEASVDFAVSQNMLHGIDGLNNMWNGTPTFDDDKVAQCQAEYSNGVSDNVPNLLEADADTNFDGIEEKDNENHFFDDLEEPLSRDLEKVMDNSPEDSTKEEEGIKQLQDNEKGFEDLNLLDKDPESMMNNAAEDSSKRELGIKQMEDSEDDYKDDLEEPFDKDPASIINRAPEDSTKADKTGGVQEANLLEEDEEDDDDTIIDPNIEECDEANLLEEDEEATRINGIIQTDAPDDDTSELSALENDPEFPTQDAELRFDNIEESNLLEEDEEDDLEDAVEECDEANLLEDDADTNFDGIEDKEPQESKASSYEVIPDAIAVPAEDRDQDGLHAEVNGPIENGDDEKINTVAEANLLEADFEDQVTAMEDDNAFYDDINTGLEGPDKNVLDDQDTADDIIDDELASEA